MNLRLRVAALALGAIAPGCGYAYTGAGIWYLTRGDGDREPAPSPAPNATPAANVATPSGTLSNDVAISYLLIDPEGDPADVTIEYAFSADGGATWSAFAPATERPGAPSEGTLGLAASSSGTPHAYVWNSFLDAGGVNGLARIRVLPTDPGPPPRAGTAGETTVSGFPLLNRLIATAAGGGTGILNFPGAVARDGAGNLFVADTFNHRIQVLNTQSAPITVAGVTITSNQLGVIAGTGIAGYNGDNIVATSAQLNFPSGIALDSSGNVLVADSLNHRIRRVDRTTGFVTTVAGTGSAGSAGDGSLATSAQLSSPRGIALDASGNLFVADTGSHVLRVVNNQSTAITVPPTGGVAVSPNAMRFFMGSVGSPGNAGDGAAAGSAALRSPWSLAVDGSGHLYVADSGNHAIRLVNMGTGATTVAGVTVSAGNVATVAGTNGTAGFSGDGGAATSALLSTPRGVALDGNGNILVADTANSRLRVVNAQAGTITLAGVSIGANQIATVAGGGASPGPNDGDGGAATSARLSQPEGIVALAGGHPAVADTGLGRLRVVNVGTTGMAVAGVTIGGGNVDSVAGTASASAALLRPAGVARAGSLLFVADTDAHRVYQVNLATGVVAPFAGTGTAGFSGDSGPAGQAQLSSPRGLALDGSGNLTIADWGNNRIRVVNRQATAQTILNVSVQPGDIRTVAGGGIGGDGGAATSADLTNSPGIALDASGNLYVAHRGGVRIRRILASTGVIGTVAGTGGGGFTDGAATGTAQLDGPEDVSLDSLGNLVVADTANHAVRYVNLGGTSVTVCGVTVAAGSLATIVGDPPPGVVQGFNGDNQAGTATQLDTPTAAVRTAAGHVLVVDSGNQRIRRVDQGTGLVSTLCGTGAAGFNGDGIPPVNAQVNGPTRLALDASTPQNLFFADAGNRRVRRFTP